MVKGFQEEMVVSEMRAETCANCGGTAWFEKAEDGSYYMWEECPCSEFQPQPADLREPDDEPT
jgi:hypothetical protein